MRITTPSIFVTLIAACVLGVACGGSSSPTSPSTPQPPPSLNACGAIGGASSTGGLAILNGSTCQPTNSRVVLLVLRDSNGVGFATCSGTVIAPRAVLTAAHCLKSPLASVVMSFGTTAAYPSTSFYSSPDYRGDTDPGSIDLGVVLTDADFPQTPVPLLVNRDAAVGEQAVIAGWGQDQNGSVKTLHAGTAAITAVSTLSLQTQYSLGTTSGVCYGDSGGPILLSQGGVWSVAGVTSAFSGNSCTTGTNIFVNLRNASASQFVLGLVPGAARR